MLTRTIIISIVLSALSMPSLASKLGTTPFAHGPKVESGTAISVGEAVASELRRYPGLELLTYQDLQVLLSEQQRRQLIGCDGDNCYIELSSKMGLRYLLAGRISKPDTSILFHLEILDTEAVKVIAAHDRRLADGTIERVLDAIPTIVGSLMETAYPIIHQKPKPKLRGFTLPSATADVALKSTPKTKELTYLTDDKGHYLVFDTQLRSNQPLFAGDHRTLYEQRVASRSKAGAPLQSFSMAFWDPRFRDGWQRNFGMKDGKYTLRCGETVVSFQPVAPEHVPKASFFEPRWQRQAFALARDDMGDYYYVDRARSPKDNRDFRLFVGPRGKIEPMVIEDVIHDSSGTIVVTPEGRLVLKRIERDGQLKDIAFWVVGRAKTELSRLNLYTEAAMVYTKLGAYRGQRLGTPCDPYLTSPEH